MKGPFFVYGLKKGSILIVALFVIAAVLFYFYLATKTQKTATTTTITQPTPTPQNPFSQSTNPFVQPTTYQNPFSATASANQEYKNPFEQLK